ncbi:MAG: hypothetical protein WD156_08750 [Acidimicrobiia bacterium]
MSWRWGRFTEKVLLLGYWGIGYGERITRPLVAWVVIALGGAFTLGTEAFPEFAAETAADRFEYLILAPLAVLRVTTATPTGESWVIPAMRLVGLLCIGTALLAARRIGRAE